LRAPAVSHRKRARWLLCAIGVDQFQKRRALERVDPGLAQKANGVEIEDLVLSGEASMGITGRPRYDAGLVVAGIAAASMARICAAVRSSVMARAPFFGAF